MCQTLVSCTKLLGVYMLLFTCTKKHVDSGTDYFYMKIIPRNYENVCFTRTCQLVYQTSQRLYYPNNESRHTTTQRMVLGVAAEPAINCHLQTTISYEAAAPASTCCTSLVDDSFIQPKQPNTTSQTQAYSEAAALVSTLVQSRTTVWPMGNCNASQSTSI